MSKRRIGGYDFQYECVRIEDASSALRNALTQIIETNPGPQTINALSARMAIQVSVITDAINQIKAIGRENKKART